jgi:hypothetical protein
MKTRDKVCYGLGAFGFTVCAIILAVWAGLMGCAGDVCVAMAQHLFGH